MAAYALQRGRVQTARILWQGFFGAYAAMPLCQLTPV